MVCFDQRATRADFSSPCLVSRRCLFSPLLALKLAAIARSPMKLTFVLRGAKCLAGISNKTLFLPSAEPQLLRPARKRWGRIVGCDRSITLLHWNDTFPVKRARRNPADRTRMCTCNFAKRSRWREREKKIEQRSFDDCARCDNCYHYLIYYYLLFFVLIATSVYRGRYVIITANVLSRR